ncbi:MAG TPA: hypothetical protein VD833_22705 [Vicinamibacterales bacterium]|nr:hypothetical protein [Vicinamibacterales bacterium]
MSAAWKSARQLVIGAAAVAVLASFMTPVGAKSEKAGSKSIGQVRKVGTTRLSAATVVPGRGEPGPSTVGELRPRVRLVEPAITGNKSFAHVPSANVPRPATSPVQDATGTPGFNGLNHRNQRLAGTGAYANTQFSLEPPDQALCVNGSVVVESVNTAVRVRNKAGVDLTPPVPLNQFFNVAPALVRAPTVAFGPFLADPKCYWDADTDRWFLTILDLETVPTTGAFSGVTKILIAVSQTADPVGAWNIFEIVTTTDGAQGNCPCFGDQPLIGADANGFYVSTNVFPLFQGGFNGAMVYAMSKASLAAGVAPALVKFHQPTLAEGFAYSLQPTTTPPGASHAIENGGTEYFLSALEFTGRTDDRIALWAMTNTSSLADATPDVEMQVTVLGTLTYGQPPAVLQKDGPTPLRELLGLPLAVDLGLVTRPSLEHLNLLNSNDDRMNQTVYINGQVWGALNTAVKGPTGPTRVGIAWFVVEPAWTAGTLGGSVANDGYVAVDTNSVMFPAVAANAAGAGLIVFSLAGPGVYPSAAYVTFDPVSGTGPVRVVRWGDGPADGFTGYLSLAGGVGVERWGDYSAAVADPEGTVWIATEYIDSVCGLDEFLATGGACADLSRTLFANWGTWIAGVSP